MANYLLINGHSYQEPSSLEIAHEDLWSSNSGRTKSGKWTGDLIGWKWQIQATYSPVSKATTKSLMSAITASSIPITFLSPLSNTTKTISCYAGEIRVSPYNYEISGAEYASLSVTFVER